VGTTYIAYANPEVKLTVQEPAFPFCTSTFQNIHFCSKKMEEEKLRRSGKR